MVKKKSTKKKPIMKSYRITYAGDDMYDNPYTETTTVKAYSKKRAEKEVMDWNGVYEIIASREI